MQRRTDYVALGPMAKTRGCREKSENAEVSIQILSFPFSWQPFRMVSTSLPNLWGTNVVPYPRTTLPLLGASNITFQPHEMGAVIVAYSFLSAPLIMVAFLALLGDTFRS